MAIDYQRIIDRMDSKPIPENFPRISREAQDSIGEYFWEISHILTAAGIDAEKPMSSSFHVIMLGWNFGKPASVVAASLT